MKNKGKRRRRCKNNPLEKRFAEEWEQINLKDSNGTLNYLLSETINYPLGRVSERDRMVAATVIQWLGSPVGQQFIARTKTKTYGLVTCSRSNCYCPDGCNHKFPHKPSSIETDSKGHGVLCSEESAECGYRVDNPMCICR